MNGLKTCGLILLTTLLLTACEEPTPPVPPESMRYSPGSLPADQDVQSEERTSPGAPLHENFEGAPQLSLFPRVGDYQPPRGDERHPFWETFIDHFTRTSGLMQSPDEPPNHAWSFRSINTIDSVAYFSPLAVEPETAYRVSFRMQTNLPEEASAGVGVLEFDQFLWIGEQYDEETIRTHLVAPALIGQRLEGENTLAELHQFDFTTGPRTRMVHLVFFREGPHARHSVLLDDVAIEPLEPTAN